MISKIVLLSVTLCVFIAGDCSAGALNPAMVFVPAGKFIMGSDTKQREYGYTLDEQNGSNAARKYGWFEVERRGEIILDSFYIDVYPVTNTAYLSFVKATGRSAPFVDKKTWNGYHLAHSYKEVQRFLWKDGKYPDGRGKHPVVLVTHDDAQSFCRYRGLRLPTEQEWEKAARGPDGRYFPWGDAFKPTALNSYNKGPYDTTPVGSYSNGKSFYGLYDMAGQVFEWTATPDVRKGKFIVKGGSWDDYPGVTRSAARHGRPTDIKHILIGFRCAGDQAPK